MFSRGWASATQRQKFHADDVNQCLHNKSGGHGVPKTKNKRFVQGIVCFSGSILLKLLCSSCCKQASEKLKCFFWRRIIIFHKYWLFCLYSWRLHSLWPFVFCLSFISNNLNNVTSPSSNQCFWPDSRLILHHHYGIFCRWVAEVPPHEMSPCKGKEPGKN